MPSKSQLNTDVIPHNDQTYVNRLRKFLNDTAALNTLDGAQEAEDIDLYHYIQDALDEINYDDYYEKIPARGGEKFVRDMEIRGNRIGID